MICRSTFSPYLCNLVIQNRRYQWGFAKIPAVRGWNVCRFHGARGGAPKGKANGAWKHSCYTEAAKAERLLVKQLLKDASSLQKLFSKDKRDC
jgi:hypothetical protein